MRRRTFDFLASWVGVFLAVVLAVAGGLLMYAHSFVSDQVKTELSAQKIVFPAAGSDSLKTLPPADAAAMAKFAGQPLTTGDEAKTWANSYINVHLGKIGGGLTYSELSAKAMADPTNTQLAGQVDTVFRGETLRGLLLNAYAFWQMGQIALIAGIAALVSAVIMLTMSILGFVHLRKTPAEKELLTERHAALEPALA
ncbi:hypothetical protein ACPPVS_05155 [Cellulomonas sp. McL0617]|uniref:hypothetical protein n=1 Tax=Cellulomonas sp. McL0617 TaxID=3415675 RepID=UPI003CF002C6